MEGPLEIKDSTANAEEPIKSEAPVQNSDSSERSDGAASPPPNCSICLGKLVNTSFTDSCLHQFCFTCLLQWSKIKTECPLCKQTFKSIIHNVRSEEDYDQYHVPRELASQIPQPQVMATLDVNFDVDGNLDVGLRRFVYRTTMTNRRHGVLLNPEQVARREQLPSISPQVPRDERRRRRSNPTDYRRTVYRHGVWATALPDVFGRFRECSAEYYRRQPRELDRLIPWLNRELQVLLNNEPPHIAYVLSIIMDALIQYDIRSPEFRNIVRPYFNIHTDHFIHELLNFARTNFDLIGYDQSVTYLPRGLSNEFVPRVISPTSSSSSSTGAGSSVTSDNSDVRILDEAIDLRVNTLMPIELTRNVNPGPSTVREIFHVMDTSYNTPELLILSSSSSGSDGECQVIGYVKPRHERTPEIIELLSSDSEPVTIPHTHNENTQSASGATLPETLLPSTSQFTKAPSFSSSTTSADVNSDSDCNQRQNKESRSKRSSKKKLIIQKHKKSDRTESRNKRSTNLSSSGETDVRKKSNARISSSSDSSSSESLPKKYDKERSRRERRNVKNKRRVNFVKKEGKYLNEDSSSSESSSAETDKTKIEKHHGQYKRKRLSSSSDYTAKSGKTIRNSERTSVTEKEKSKCNKKERKYSETRQSRSRSPSVSSNASETEKRSSYRHREYRDTSEYGSQDDSASKNKDTRREHKSRKRLCYSSDSEEDRFRSSSQCSNYSDKCYSHRRLKRKEKYKNKERHTSTSKIFSPSQYNSNTASVPTSSKDEAHSTKHADSYDSGCKEKHKSHKAHKGSKHKKSQNEKKSKPKKRRRRFRSTSASNST